MSENKKLYVLEVRTDYRPADTRDLVQQFIKEKAKELVTFTGLLQDGAKPEIMAYTHDYINGHAPIELFTAEQMSGAEPLSEVLVATHDYIPGPDRCKPQEA